MAETAQEKKARLDAELADDAKAAPREGDSHGDVLKVSVTVHTERGPVTYQAGDKVPAGHQDLISNPDVWEEKGKKDK